MAFPSSASGLESEWNPRTHSKPFLTSVCLFHFRTSRATWRTDRDMGLMNAIGLQPRNPTTSVTSQGTQTLALQLQNAETQTEREEEEPGTTSSGPGEGRSWGHLNENHLSSQGELDVCLWRTKAVYQRVCVESECHRECSFQIQGRVPSLSPIN